jgi:hypothetical protein
MTWREHIACADLDDDKRDDFFTTRHDQERSPGVTRALRICASCPVRAECEADMLAYDEPPYMMVVAGMRPRQARRYWFEQNDGAPPVNRAANFAGTGGQCGTDQGHKRHMRRGEEACRPCKDAHNEHNRMWRKMA